MSHQKWHGAGCDCWRRASGLCVSVGLVCMLLMGGGGG